MDDKAMTGRKPLYIALPVAILSGLAIVLYLVRTDRTGSGSAPVAPSEQALIPFMGDGPLTRKDFENLEAYFQDGFEAYKDAEGASAHYPGLSSDHRGRTDRIEGFTRMAPLLAVWVRANSPPSTQAQRSRQLLIDGLTHGSDPKSPGYWGQIHDNDQRIVEASDVALTVWLLRDSAWPDLTPATRLQVIQWLLQVNDKKVPDNNWHLFVTYVNLVVRALGYQDDEKEALAHYSRFRGFYKGDGWFSDGPEPRFDYYNAWGIHYQLFWIDQVAPTFDHAFITTALDQFAQKLVFLIGPNGIPILGRSICYRMAVSAPLILDQRLAHASVSPGVARRALDVTWRYFIRRGGVGNGRITQGYCASDARLLDNYSGPASCFWSLRSLIAALYLAPSDAFWEAPEQPLPVERSNYTIEFQQPGWIVRGSSPDLIVIDRPSGSGPYPLKDEGLLLLTYDRLAKRAHRPENELAKYGGSEYRSDVPFCGCAVPR